MTHASITTMIPTMCVCGGQVVWFVN